MKKAVVIGMAVVMAVACSMGVAAKEMVAPEKPKVQLALLLDTSNSMDGLIEQAKNQLWKIVNQFSTATDRNGVRPDIEVALYHYGTPSLGANTGYVKQLVSLSTDLDKVSEELFKLRTDGGDEYCGTVIGKAVDELAWNSGKNDYRAIFIAGNEPFTQGKIDFRKTCAAAIKKGVVVNTIFCGNNDEGIRTEWKAGADLADGSYLSIDQNRQVVNIPTPFDKELAELGTKLNDTYIAFGAKGAEGYARQRAQDANAESAAPGTAVQRSVAKSSASYKNASWDLVDAVREQKADLSKLEDKELPAEMQEMKEAERKAYVETKAKDRAAIQEKITKLNKQRDEFVLNEQKKQATGPANTLDTAIISAIRTQAQKNGIKFE